MARSTKGLDLLRVVNRIEADLQVAAKLAEIKQTIAEMVEMEPAPQQEPELSPQQHRERYGGAISAMGISSCVRATAGIGDEICFAKGQIWYGITVRNSVRKSPRGMAKNGSFTGV